MTKETPAALEGLIEGFAREHHIPGLAFGLVREGAPHWFKSVGFGDCDANQSVTAATRFRIASMTKNTTALAILMLRDSGKVALDAPAAAYVPELVGLRLPTEDARPMTVRDLLNHSSGLVTDDPWGDRQLGIAPSAFSDMLKAGHLYAQAPGLTFEYSNLGYAILGRIITNTVGQPYQDFIRDKLFRPLGMSATSFDFHTTPAQMRAIGYRWTGERWTAEAAEADGEFGAMGGIVTTADDYARYVAFLLSAWPARDGVETGPMQRASVRELGLSHGFPLAATREANGKTIPIASTYGYGMVHSLESPLGRTLHHRGGLPGYGSHVLISPETGIGIFAFANVTYAEMDKLTFAAADALYAAGSWKPRARRLSPMLKEAVGLAMRFYAAGRIDEASDLFAENLLPDQPAAERNEKLAALKAQLGDGVLTHIDAMHDLGGRFTALCANGTLKGTVILTPGPRPKVQTLRYELDMAK